RAALAALHAGASPVIVVLGADAERIAPTVRDVGGVQVVNNADWRTGLASSLAAGLRALDPAPAGTAPAGTVACDAALVVLADQPLVEAADLRRLIAEFGPERRVVAAAYS